MNDIAHNLAQVRDKISAAATRCGRASEEVTLLAVSKTKPASAIAEAIDAGQRAFGENYVQEGVDKIRYFRQSGVSALQWHFIGPLQSNKSRLVAEPGQALPVLGPDLVPLARVFPSQPGLDVGKISHELEAAFNDLASLRERNPFGNSVKLLALDINKRLDKGSLTYGGIETLISHPATMTHAGYTQAERDALGIGDGMVRISVGCEDADDLLADLAQAFSGV